MDMRRWEWIPRFLNAYIDARVEDEVKKRLHKQPPGEATPEAQREAKPTPDAADIRTANLANRAKSHAQRRKSGSYTPAVNRKRSTADTASASSSSSTTAPKRTSRTKSLTHDQLLRELQETRRYLERLEAQLVQITHKAGYTDLLNKPQASKKTARRSL